MISNPLINRIFRPHEDPNGIIVGANPSETRVHTGVAPLGQALAS
jgi:hypothetical protein